MAVGAARVSPCGRGEHQQFGTDASEAACGRGLPEARSSTEAAGGCRNSYRRTLQMQRESLAVGVACGSSGSGQQLRVQRATGAAGAARIARCGCCVQQQLGADAGGQCETETAGAQALAAKSASGDGCRSGSSRSPWASRASAARDRRFRGGSARRRPLGQHGVHPGRLQDQMHNARRGLQELGKAASRLRLRVQL